MLSRRIYETINDTEFEIISTFKNGKPDECRVKADGQIYPNVRFSVTFENPIEYIQKTEGWSNQRVLQELMENYALLMKCVVLGVVQEKGDWVGINFELIVRKLTGFPEATINTKTISDPNTHYHLQYCLGFPTEQDEKQLTPEQEFARNLNVTYEFKRKSEGTETNTHPGGV